MSQGRLPPEIWLEVFRWAVTHASIEKFYTAKYLPFQTSHNYQVLDESLKVKAVVVRVCRQWRMLAEDMLYEDLRIRHGEQTLANVLESYEKLGRWVRRVELPYRNTITTTVQPLRPLAILKCCPELEVLVRPDPVRSDDLRFEFPAEALPLTSLKRLEWWNVDEAARSGGINSLDDVLNNSPNLQYLSIGGQHWITQFRPAHHLPSVTTLCLRWMNDRFIRQICRWSLPSLAHIIIDSSQGNSVLGMLWETFGSQVQVMELGTHMRFYLEDHLTSMLENCPNLQQLNYHIHFTVPPALSVVHSSLRSICLHGQVNEMASDRGWVHLRLHFAFFSGPSLPLLKRIVLYGEWHAILTDDRFARMHRELHARNCDLQLSDGTVIQVPAR